MIRRPLAIDLFAGLFGWSEGLVAEGWAVVGIDLEDMHENFGLVRRPEFGLIIQDVLTVDGRAFSGADLIVASPPCQEFSWLAMPWRRAKQVGRALRGGDCFPINYRGSRTIEDLNRLFDACFRIQREACEAAGHHIPLVIENVRSAQQWVGSARANFGSFYFWGSGVPALMPSTVRFAKVPGFRFDGSGRSFQSASVEHVIPSDSATGDCVLRQDGSGRKHHESGAAWRRTGHGKLPSASPRRKMASALIAKIPLEVSMWIAHTHFPRNGLRSCGQPINIRECGQNVLQKISPDAGPVC